MYQQKFNLKVYDRVFLAIIFLGLAVLLLSKLSQHTLINSILLLCFIVYQGFIRSNIVDLIVAQNKEFILHCMENADMEGLAQYINTRKLGLNSNDIRKICIKYKKREL